jgi:hypothetical protein
MPYAPTWKQQERETENSTGDLSNTDVFKRLQYLAETKY